MCVKFEGSEAQHLPFTKNSKNRNNEGHVFADPKSTDGNPSPRVWIEAYGCSANMADSQAIAGALSANGFEIANLSEDHDLNVIVTCSVDGQLRESCNHGYTVH